MSKSGTLDNKLVNLLRKFKIAPEKVRQRRRSGPGTHPSKGLGQSLDFSEYRPYQPGDDLRSLDWKVYGRTDRLYTKRYVPEQDETVYLLLDTSESMRLKWAVSHTIILGLASVILGQGDRVALLPLQNSTLQDVRGVPPSRGRSSLSRVANFLSSTTPSGVTELGPAFELAAKRLKTRSHVVIVSDFLQPGAGLEGLSQLHYRRHRLSLIQLLTPQEQSPEGEMSPGEWELFDPEPEEFAQSSVRLDLGRRSFQRYRDCLQQHNQLLQEFARTTGAVYLMATSDLDPMTFFSEHLRRAGLLS